MAKKNTRRAKGEGSIFKRKDGTWAGKVPTGYNTDGSMKYRYFYGKTQGEVKEKIEATKSDIRNNVFCEPNKVTMSEWLDNWLNVTIKGNVKDTTWLLYESLIRKHINPEIGGIRLMNLLTSHIQKLYNTKMVSGRADKRKNEKTGELEQKEGGLAPMTIRHIHQVIKSALDQAIKEKLISVNPAAATRLPKLEKKEMLILDIEEVKQLLNFCREDLVYKRYYPSFLLELYTGLRRGELLGLRWKDIDLKNSAVTVIQQVVKVGSKHVIRELKTESSQNRVIALPDEITAIFKDLKKQKSDELKALGHNDIEVKKMLPEGFVFTNETNGFIQPKNFTRSFKRALQLAGINEIRWHDMRHTAAVMSLQAGVDIKTLQSDLGHESIETTLDRYGHVNKEMKRDAANKRSGLLKGIVAGDKV